MKSGHWLVTSADFLCHIGTSPFPQAQRVTPCLMLEVKRLACSVLLGAGVALTGCANLATPYQPFDRSLMSFGGYQDFAVSDGIYEVRIYINEFTSEQTGNSYLERRSQELCREKGYLSTVYLGEESHPPPAPSMRGRAIRIRCVK
jgi:hypothetical protein